MTTPSITPSSDQVSTAVGGILSLARESDEAAPVHARVRTYEEAYFGLDNTLANVMRMLNEKDSAFAESMSVFDGLESRPLQVVLLVLCLSLHRNRSLSLSQMKENSDFRIFRKRVWNRTVDSDLERMIKDGIYVQVYGHTGFRSIQRIYLIELILAGVNEQIDSGEGQLEGENNNDEAVRRPGRGQTHVPTGFWKLIDSPQDAQL